MTARLLCNNKSALACAKQNLPQYGANLHMAGDYDVEEELYPTTECETNGITYSGIILPIIENNCYSCHDAANNFGGITLEGYTQLKSYVDNGSLLGVIRHDSGFSPMPKNLAKLLDCEIAKIETWINNGAPDN